MSSELKKSAIRICHVLQDNTGGGPKIAEIILRAQAEAGFLTSVIFLKSKRSGWCSFSDAEISISIFGNESLERRRFWPFAEMRRVLAFRKALKQIEPHLLILHGHTPIRIAYMASFFPGPRPCRIGYVHAALTENIRTNLGWLFRFAIKPAQWLSIKATQSVDTVIFVCEDLLKLFQSMGFRHPRTKVLFNPVSESARGIIHSVAETWLNDKRLSCFVCAARMEPQKDHKTLLSAFEKVAHARPESRLILLGDGPLQNSVRQQARELGIEDKLLFAGYVINPQDYFSRCRAVILSSHWEGFGLVLTEALRRGVSFIASDCPVGPREIKRRFSAGDLFPTGDHEKLATLMIDHVDHPRKVSLSDELLALISEPSFRKKILNETYHTLHYRGVETQCSPQLEEALR